MKKDFSDSKYQNIKAAVIVDDEVIIRFENYDEVAIKINY
jgi:hypothetical protein